MRSSIRAAARRFAGSKTVETRTKSTTGQSRGKVMRVISSDDLTELFRRESVRAPVSDRAAVAKIVYEGDDISGPVLTFFFRHPVAFKVGQGRDPATTLAPRCSVTSATDRPLGRQSASPTRPPIIRATTGPASFVSNVTRATARPRPGRSARTSRTALAVMLANTRMGRTRSTRSRIRSHIRSAS